MIETFSLKFYWLFFVKRFLFVIKKEKNKNSFKHNIFKQKIARPPETTKKPLLICTKFITQCAENVLFTEYVLCVQNGYLYYKGSKISEKDSKSAQTPMHNQHTHTHSDKNLIQKH